MAILIQNVYFIYVALISIDNTGYTRANIIVGESLFIIADELFIHDKLRMKIQGFS